MEDLTFDECMELLTGEQVAHLGVVTERGPYVTPLSYVFSGERLAFRTRPGERLRALDSDPRVCVEVSRYNSETGDWVSVVARGTAARVTDDREIQAVTQALLAKYRPAIGSLLAIGGSPPLGDEVVVAIDLEEITGRSSGSFFAFRSKPGRF